MAALFWLELNGRAFVAKVKVNRKGSTILFNYWGYNLSWKAL